VPVADLTPRALRSGAQAYANKLLTQSRGMDAVVARRSGKEPSAAHGASMRMNMHSLLCSHNAHLPR